MAYNLTTYLQLEMPTVDERFNLAKMNSNWEKIDTGCSKIGNLDGSRSISSASADLNAGYSEMPAGIIRVGTNVQHTPGSGIVLNLTGSAFNTQIWGANTTTNVPSLKVRAFRSTDAEIPAKWYGIPLEENVVATIDNNSYTYMRTGSGFCDKMIMDLPTYYRGIVLIHGRSEVAGVYLVTQPSSSSNNPNIVPIGTPGTDLSFSVSAHTVTFQTGSSYACYPEVINLNGVASCTLGLYTT